MKILLTNLNKAAVLAALYNHSRPLGLGMLAFDPTPMSIETAKEFLTQSYYFDYLKGRVMKVSLQGNVLDTCLYDRDNGEGAAKKALENAGLVVSLATEDGGHKTSLT